jgi:dTMP kinase
LEARDLEIVTTREPGGSERGEAIREFLLCGAARDYGPFAEALLFASARAEHLDRIIWPALERGAVVICDRFADSTRVYQGDLGELPRSLVGSLERIALRDIRPDLTVVLDVPPKLGLARASARRGDRGDAADRFEAEDLAFHARVRESFLKIAGDEPERFAVIDAAGPPDAVERLIWAEVEGRLLAPAQPPEFGLPNGP